MSPTTHRPRPTRPARGTSRYLLAFASAAFITGALAIPASAATAPTAPSAVAGVLTDIPGTNDDTTEYGGYIGPSDTGGILKGGEGGSGGNNPYREPGGGAYGPDTCKAGYVWRDSFDGDTICVEPEYRQYVHDLNPHRQAGGGAYGPSTCEQGYVWRESFDGDTKCVTPAERDVAKAGAN
ncbi:hypothetical protein AB0B78_31155 [Streptomyces sp. NPDC040724]|uniref:hypothetical protein n=1 Tax=Streptomyces sp. NPDC040724 TaxID=3155612 RepID=UPI0033ED6D0C